MRLKHKYNAKPTEVDNIRFDSKLEANYYGVLKLAQKSGELLFFLRQVPLHLPGNTKYVCDFLEFWAPKNGDSGDVVFTDVKGMETATFKLKKKQVEALYPIEIQVITKC